MWVLTGPTGLGSVASEQRHMSLSADADAQAFAGAVQNSLAVSTRATYGRVFEAFRAYVTLHHLPCATADDLIAAAARFLGSRIRDGYAAASGQQLHSALSIAYPSLAGHLRPLHRGIRGWANQRPTVKRPPLIRPLAAIMAMVLVVRGEPAMGVAVLLAHHCYLRVGELLRVRVWHVVGPRSPRTGYTNRHAFVHIPRAKTGDMQDVEISDPHVAWLMAVAMRAARERASDDGANALVFPCAQHTFRKRFAASAAALGLPPSIVPHSMRHGGATHDYASGARTAAEIQVRGRWRSDKSMVYYVGQMRSALATLSVPPKSVSSGAAIQQCLALSFKEMLKRADGHNHDIAAYRRAVAFVESKGLIAP